MSIWFVDTETGGLDHEVYSVIEVAMARLHEGKITDRYHAYVKEDPISISPEAMAVNQIDLRADLPWKDARTVAYDIGNMIAKYEELNYAVLGGHNLPFDKDFLGRIYKSNGLRFPFSRRFVDTSVIGRFLQDIGVIPECGCKLTQLCEYFCIDTSAAHTAAGDVDMTIALYKGMCDLVGSAFFE